MTGKSGQSGQTRPDRRMSVKNCSGCGTRHAGPFGSWCKQRGMATVAGSGFDDPSDPGYVEFLEGKFLESQRAGKDAGRIESALDNIMHRLDTLETRQVQQAPVQAPAPY